MTGQVLDSDLHLTSPVDTPGSAIRGWRAGQLLVDLELHRVQSGADRVVLQETPFRLLCLLLARAGRPLSRRDIHHALWPRHDWDSFERNVNTAMRKLRRAIGDDAREPRLIETLRASGYRWIGPSPFALDERALADAGTRLAVAPGAQGSNRSSRTSRPSRWIAGAAALGACLLLGMALWPAGARQPWAVVEAADAVGGPIAASPAARALVDLLESAGLTAAASDGGEPVHVALTVRGGQPVAAEVDGRGPAQRIALGGAAFGPELLLAEVASRLPSAALEQASSTLPEFAQRAYADAGSLLLAASGRDAVERAVHLLEAVLSVAPAHAGALRTYARAQRMLAVLGRDPVAARDRRRLAHAALRRAVAADPRSAAAAADVAGQLFWGEWDAQQAARWFDLARREAPQDADILHAYAWFALGNDRVEAAMQAMNAALALAPLNVALHADLGWFYFRTSRYDDALRQCRIALGMSGHDGSAQTCEERSLFELGRPQEAWMALRRHEPAWLDAGAAQRLDRLDPADAYRTAMRLAAGDVRRRLGAGFDSACLEAIAGERDAAETDLAAAVALRDPGLHMAPLTPELVRLLGESGVRRLSGDAGRRLASGTPIGRRLEQRQWNRL